MVMKKNKVIAVLLFLPMLIFLGYNICDLVMLVYKMGGSKALIHMFGYICIMIFLCSCMVGGLHMWMKNEK